MNDQKIGHRRHRRYVMEDKIIGTIRHENDQAQYELVDISESGMCVVTTKRLPHDVVLSIKLHGRVLNVRSVWYKPMSHDPVRYRYGLTRVTEDQDVIDAFVAGGKLDDDLLADRDEEFLDVYS